VSVADIAGVYEFDAKLRALLLRGIAPFEIALRSRLGYYMAVNGHAYGYLDPGT
jgi:abortive infection bacteriophage resistance protein